MSDLAALKKKLREQIHISLRTHAGRQAPEAPALVRDHFFSHFPPLDPALVIAGTSPIKNELNPMLLMQALAQKGHSLCLPITLQKATPLLFRAYKIGDTLIPNVWDIGIPQETQPVCIPDLLLCPMLAFDRKGGRLGYGGGYYDATLQSLRKQKHIIAVGIAYAVQEVEAVPLGTYDEKMDVILTEKEVIVANRQG
ncbi:MAG: 5-formyltetrahydrofolate cyclo-ligase [Alphaproteobacteria bacterium]|nr:5-formyltetrahydrofolate cyclo-ligase [Alphaproteobacteria bacterium]